MKQYMQPRMLFLLILILPAVTFSQQQEILLLDSCNRYSTTSNSAFADVHVRVSQPARWNNKMSIGDFFQTYFSKYVQKKAGGKITLSLLITSKGEVCFYKAQPNSNVRPDYKELKALLDQTRWHPALQGDEPVTSLIVLFLHFEGKKVTVTQLE
jgi:hypothetical protein